MLKREIGLIGAIALGLGSILGTGVFVSIGLASVTAGSWVILAVFVAGIIAVCNGLNSAQLAAAHPKSGGTYEYGYHFVSPFFGQLAGWTFLLAKSASAAAACLGCSGYLHYLLGVNDTGSLQLLALSLLFLCTLLAVLQVKQSTRTNAVLVLPVLLTLLYFIVGSIDKEVVSLGQFWSGDFPGISNFFYTVALLFVAYTGYGRIATLSEEVVNPAVTIPRAIIWTLAISFMIYLGVALGLTQELSEQELVRASERQIAPLMIAAENRGLPYALPILGLAAAIAMFAVLLNLILGLSRVALAMARRRDLPPMMAAVNSKSGTPTIAVIAVAVVVALIILFLNIRQAWSLSALSVLIYYGVTNLAALKLPAQKRRYPRALAYLGLVLCLVPVAFIPIMVWVCGIVSIGIGLGLSKLVKLSSTPPGYGN